MEDEESLLETTPIVVSSLTTAPLSIDAALPPPTETPTPPIQLAIEECLTHLEEDQTRIKGLLLQILAHL